MNRPFLTERQLEALAMSLERSLSRDLSRTLLQIQRGVPLSAVERAILRRDIETAVDLLGFDQIRSAVSAIPSGTIPLRDASWLSALRDLPNRILTQPLVVVSFDAFAALNQDRAAAFTRLQLDQITGVTDESRAAIRDAIGRALVRGTPPRELARQIRDTLGLNRRQVAALEKFRAALVAEGRDPAQIDRMAARRAAQLLRDRAENVARTSLIGTLNDAKRLQWERLVREGKLDPNEWEQIYKTADDERVDCVLCAPFDERTAPIGGLFTPDPAKVKPGTPATISGPILHPRCRCVTVLGQVGLRAFRLRLGGSARARVLRGVG